MHKMSTDVRAFHEKHGFPYGLSLDKAPVNRDAQLVLLGEKLMDMAEAIKALALQDQLDGDERLYRAHLMMEELGEAVVAMGNKDEIELADATADLRYVVVGTDVTYNIPSESVDEVVHASNMSKAKRTSCDPRMRNKGPDYFAPNIEGAIISGRLMKDWVTHEKV